MGRILLRRAGEFRGPSEKGGWVFEGRILIRDTGDDRMSIKRFDANSIRIMRFLSGDNTGKKQWTSTKPPKIYRKSGQMIAEFESRSGNGVGCNNDYTRLYVNY